MPRLYQTKIWQLQMPDAWAVRDDHEQELVTFFRPDGVGLLSVLTTEQSPPRQNGNREDFRGKLPGTMWTTKGSDRIWRAWSLSCRGQRLFVRYTCAAKNAGLEDLEVDEILQSIEESGTQVA
jgi:hypothetical protein